jgi:hypothetical protein
MFHHWLSAARTSRRRRVSLQQKEDEVKRWRMAVAWDRWRDRFNDEKLRPIVGASFLLIFFSFQIRDFFTHCRNMTFSCNAKTFLFFVPLAYGIQKQRLDLPHMKPIPALIQALLVLACYPVLRIQLQGEILAALERIHASSSSS